MAIEHLAHKSTARVVIVLLFAVKTFFVEEKVIDRFEEETEKGIKVTERERIVTQINAFDLNTGKYLQIV